ncbi:uncharacterized protein LOC118648694 [Monomorium pharaonis]|uniref:uncharacterized protein LOC118648694 n=1 Tax=Monomorium pharaonis TaxID=307658 RepID=UPI001745F1A7|nr:uncharacterized protein LOC118648694 [Monomorium pharaonis]
MDFQSVNPLNVRLNMVSVPGYFFVPKEKALKDGLIGLVITMEVITTVIRIHTCRGLVQQLIQNLNDILRMDDELMRNIVITTIKAMEMPLKFYWSAGVMSILLWIDYRMPVIFSKEPFSTGIFVLGSVVMMSSSAYIFTKKVSVDSYMINMILLTTAQYKYVALKLSMIFQNKSLPSDQDKSDTKKCHLKRDYYIEKKIKALCRHHNMIIQ